MEHFHLLEIHLKAPLETGTSHDMGTNGREEIRLGEMHRPLNKQGKIHY